MLLGGAGILYYMVGHPSLGSYTKPAIVALAIAVIMASLVIDRNLEKSFETVKS